MSAADHQSAPIAEDEAAALLSGIGEFRHVAIAVSGGSDSMALLRLCATFVSGRRIPVRLTALTVDHALRPGSDEEAERVGTWCRTAGVDHVTLHWEGTKPSSRIQERAREARYALMTAWCRDNGAEALLTAHNLEDQAETVLMRLARSSGIDGLAGIPARSERDGVVLLRPLLGVARQRLVATLGKLGQGHIEDPSNSDPKFERVRLRSVAPTLSEIGLDPVALAGTARKAARASEALNRMAGSVFTNCVTVDAAGFARLDPAFFLPEPEEIRLRVLDRALFAVARRERAAGGCAERLDAALTEQSFPGLTCAGCRILKHRESILVVREARDLPSLTLEPGETARWDRRFEVRLPAGENPVEVAAIGRREFEDLRRREPCWSALPVPAGAVLPAGFRDGSLALVPDLHGSGEEAVLSARFVVPGSP